MAQQTTAHGAHTEHGGHDHHELSFWRKYVFSTDHKVIGLQYGLTAFCFMLIGLFLMLAMRWQMAYPGQALPIVGGLLQALLGDMWVGNDAAGVPGVMLPDLYNSFGAMHGTIMVFLAIVPIGVGAFGNYVVPLQIGAPDMAFPRLNMVSYQSYLFGGLLMLASFVMPAGAAKSGWTSYSPLASVNDLTHMLNGQTMWLIGMVFNISASLLGSINFVTTIIQLRAKGMNWMRLPFFVWAEFVTAFLLILAFPPLEAAAVMQLVDNLTGSSFFLPSGMVVSGQPLNISGGGSPLLWQHLFWFLGHPEVYILLLPAIGIVAEVIANNTRKPLWGYRSMVYGVLAIGFLSFIVWAHHMYLTGMGTKISTFFQTTTMMISIPSVILLTCLFISLWGGSIRFNVPMLFSLAFLVMFGIGGITGLPLGFNASDIQLHDTYYVIAHFHYVVAPGIIFGFFAGVYYWFPKMTGRYMNEFWGKVHFWLSLIFMNAVFFPMFIQGLAGMHRRMSDGGATYALSNPQNQGVADGLSDFVINLNKHISWAAVLLAVAQIPFILNLFISIRKGQKTNSDNPWKSTTLEWQTPTPPGHGNFDVVPNVYRGPYEYSVPGAKDDFTTQNELPARKSDTKNTSAK